MTDDAAARIGGLEAGARRVGEALSRAFEDGAAEGRRLDGVLRDIERTMAGMALRTAASTLGSIATQGLGSLVSSLTGLQVPLGGANLAGNLPLDRLFGANRRETAAEAPAARPVSVSVQITTPDAASFKRSEAQVSASLARAVARGARAM
ncbi:phage tail tape measure protein [Salinarimonas soli]|uniref:Phage tail tape measure protein n=1 Tax=Salinarimonas soli TaxID=1638099 RepID=A0A5B2VEJ9_9HYPH|nr:phage tail tape measure protein [Salinarimonas soli]KAA2237245.1 phage tail tape measure protein [Salinarimonas soli]